MACGKHKGPRVGCVKSRGSRRHSKPNETSGEERGDPPTKRRRDPGASSRLGRRYLGFCPWKETPNGKPLPQIERVEVNEHLPFCENCRKYPDQGALASARREGALCTRCFFNMFIQNRKPCLLRLTPGGQRPSDATRHSALADSRALRYWSDLTYLTQVAGGETIDVEVRGPQGADAFGVGQYQKLPFGEILKRLREGDTSLYVTTQRIASDRYGPKALCGPPLCGALSCDFPVLPAIAGNLVPSQFNIWVGHSDEGSTSGLHHDFHDNFYCLIRGRKEFRLYSPGLCELVRTHGMAEPSNSLFLYPNGLISYMKGIREDGAHEVSVLRTRQTTLERTADSLRRRLEEHKGRLIAASSNGANTKELQAELKALSDDLNRTEAELDDCLDAELNAAANGEEIDDDATLSKDSELLEGRLVREGAFPDHFCLSGTKQRGPASWEGPLNASNVLERFWSVWVEEGDILYLPAGWFHEVISYSQRSRTNVDCRETENGDVNVHLAFNIWLHPPMWQGTFDKPYPDEFWVRQASPQIEQQKIASAKAHRFSRTFRGSSTHQPGSKGRGSSKPLSEKCSLDAPQCSLTVAKASTCRRSQKAILSPERQEKVRKVFMRADGGTRRMLPALERLRRLRRGRGKRGFKRFK